MELINQAWYFQEYSGVPEPGEAAFQNLEWHQSQQMLNWDWAFSLSVSLFFIIMSFKMWKSGLYGTVTGLVKHQKPYVIIFSD
jgi:hypothetical protein